MDNDFEYFLLMCLVFLGTIMLIVVFVVISEPESAKLERYEARYAECMARENTEQFCIEYALGD